MKRQRDDVPDRDVMMRPLNRSTINAHMPAINDHLREAARFGEPNEKEKLVEPH